MAAAWHDDLDLDDLDIVPEAGRNTIEAVNKPEMYQPRALREGETLMSIHALASLSRGQAAGGSSPRPQAPPMRTHHPTLASFTPSFGMYQPLEGTITNAPRPLPDSLPVVFGSTEFAASPRCRARDGEEEERASKRPATSGSRYSILASFAASMPSMPFASQVAGAPASVMTIATASPLSSSVSRADTSPSAELPSTAPSRSSTTPECIVDGMGDELADDFPDETSECPSETKHESTASQLESQAPPSLPASPPWPLDAEIRPHGQKRGAAGGLLPPLFIKYPILQFALLIVSYIIGARSFDLAATPFYCQSIVGLFATAVAVISVGPRLGIRCISLGLCCFQCFICYRAVTRSPEELREGLDKTVQSVYGLIVFCFAAGMMIAVQPRAYLTVQMKLLVVATIVMMRLSALIVMATRANALRSVAFVAICSDLPFVSGFTIPMLMGAGASSTRLVVRANVKRAQGSSLSTSLWP